MNFHETPTAEACNFFIHFFYVYFSGKTVLNQKSELQRALEKQKERQMMAAQQQQKKEEHTIESELSKVIMQRAQRLENSQKENKNHDDIDDHFVSPEYLNARAKLKHTIDMK